MNKATIISVLVYCVFTVVNCVQRRSVDNVQVKVLEISSEAVFRYANVSITSVIVNKNSADQEVAFEVRLPKEAYITSFVIITGDKVIKAVIKEKGKAREIYDKAKEDNITAGLVSQQSISDDLDLEIFKIDVNVAANAEVIFLLKYEEFLHRRAQKYSQKLFIDSDHVIPLLKVRCRYKEKQKFKYLSYKTPYMKQRVLPEEGTLSNDNYYVKTIEWEPSENDQASEGTGGFKEPFVVEYELELEDNGGIAFVNNEGKFVYLFSGPCTEDKIMSKQIVFVIDISGSMDGNPIRQVRLAMSSILSQLRETDYFSIIIFDSLSTMWKVKFQRAIKENVNAAKVFVREKVQAKGGTNINDALLQAIDFFGTSESVERYGQIIVFLTDGEPTIGERNTKKIRQNVRDRNHVRGQCCKSTINTIAFGRGADVKFLQQIAYENAGTSTIIKEIDNKLAKSELVSTYNNIENPYYKNLRFDFEVAGKSLPEANFTQSILPLYDCGSEIVISGSTLPGEVIFPTVKVIGAQRDITFDTVPTVMILGVGESQMLTRLSVYKNIKKLLKEAAIALNGSVKKKTNEMALKLALEYGFVTPLTSLIVTDSMPSQNNGHVDSTMERGVPMSGTFQVRPIRPKMHVGVNNNKRMRVDVDKYKLMHEDSSFIRMSVNKSKRNKIIPKSASAGNANSSDKLFISFGYLINTCLISRMFIQIILLV